MTARLSVCVYMSVYMSSVDRSVYVSEYLSAYSSVCLSVSVFLLGKTSERTSMSIPNFLPVIVRAASMHGSRDA